MKIAFFGVLYLLSIFCFIFIAFTFITGSTLNTKSHQQTAPKENHDAYNTLQEWLLTLFPNLKHPPTQETPTLRTPKNHTPFDELRTKYKNLYRGSGFIINQTEILTAKHVIEGCNSIIVQPPHSTDWLKISSIKKSPNKDIAIIQMATPFEKIAYFKSSKAGKVQKGEPLRVAGFSTGELLIKPSNVNRVRGYARHVIGSSDNNTEMGKYGRLRISLDPKPNLGPGDSGSALIDNDGTVVGLIDSGSDERMLAIPHRSLKRALSYFGSKFYVLKHGTKSPSSPEDFATYILCGSTPR